MNNQSTQGKIRIFRAANSPVGHWWYQRLTAAALAPLSAWLVILMQKVSNTSYAETVLWLVSPVNAIAIGLWIILAIYHATLGVRVVVEDYVSTVAARTFAIRLCNLIFWVLGLAALIAILVIFLTR